MEENFISLNITTNLIIKIVSTYTGTFILNKDLFMYLHIEKNCHYCRFWHFQRLEKEIILVKLALMITMISIITFKKGICLQDLVLKDVARLCVRGDSYKVLQAQFKGLCFAGSRLARYEDTLITVHLTETSPRAVSHSITLE